MSANGKVVLITGASRGIGRAAARLFAAAGHRVAVHYRQHARAAEETLASLPGHGHCSLAADVCDPKAVASLIDEVTARLGGLDVLVKQRRRGRTPRSRRNRLRPMAGGLAAHPGHHLLGPANLSFCAAKVMIANGGGRIVNVSSRGAFRGEPKQPAYGASKAGLNALGQSLAQALAPHSVFVYTVAPGFRADGPGGHPPGGPGWRRHPRPESSEPRRPTRGDRAHAGISGHRSARFSHRLHYRRQRRLLPALMMAITAMTTPSVLGRRIITAGAALAVVMAAAADSRASGDDVFDSERQRFRIVTLVRGLDHPWGLAFLPGGDFLVTERPGRLLRVDRTTFRARTVRGLPTITAIGQGGLLDVILHPAFASNGLVYLSFTGADEDGVGTEVARGRLAGDALEEVEVIFRALPKSRGGRHFGSRLLFRRGTVAC